MGCLREGLRSKGWAVDHQPGTRVDGYLLHNHQKRDLQVGKKKGSWFLERAGNEQRESKQEGLVKGRMLWECLCLHVHCTYANSH